MLSYLLLCQLSPFFILDLVRKGFIINEGSQAIMRKSTREKVNYVFVELGLIIVSFFMFLPFILAISMSFMEPTEVFSYPPKFFPSSINLKI